MSRTDSTCSSAGSAQVKSDVTSLVSTVPLTWHSSEKHPKAEPSGLNKRGRVFLFSVIFFFQFDFSHFVPLCFKGGEKCCEITKLLHNCSRNRREFFQLSAISEEPSSENFSIQPLHPHSLCTWCPQVLWEH